MKRTKILLTSYPKLVEEWDFEKNKDLDLYKLTYGSKRTVWWKGKCGHQFQSRINSRTVRGAGCPYCNCHRKDQPLSVTHPELAEEWHSKNDKRPDQVTAGHHSRVWWKCPEGHEWEAFVHLRAPGWEKGWRCPYCSNRRASETNNLAAMCPRVAAELHPIKNGNLEARSLNYRTYREVWWLAACGHEWQTAVRNRTRTNRPSNCPFCFISQGEMRIEVILQNLGLEYKRQVRFEDCRDKKPLPFDFWVCVGEKEWLIEYQGIQHFEPVNFGGDYMMTFEDVRWHDKIKQEWCNQKRVPLLLISYLDFDRIEDMLKMTLIGREVCHP